MFLIFSLGRLDVLPVDDLGLRVAVQRHYELCEHPRRDELTRLAEPWQPYRSIATWYFWRSLGAVPQSNAKGYETNRYEISLELRAKITQRWSDVIRRYGYSEE